MTVNNSHRVTPVEIGEKTYLLRFDFNALVALEEALGTTQIDFKNLGFRGQRALLWAGLAHDAEKNITLTQVGEMLTPFLRDPKTYGAIMEAAAKAYGQAFPDAPKEPETDSKNAPATPGTGS